MTRLPWLLAVLVALLVLASPAFAGVVCGDGIITPPETCDPPGSNPPGACACNCCIANGGLGCDDPRCEAQVCAVDSFCCNVAWDEICAGEAPGFEECALCCSGQQSNCCDANGGLGCNDPNCETQVCAIDSFCCNVSWDSICAQEALSFPECLDCCTPNDCRADCTYCGDGIVNGGEPCDGPVSTDCCTASGGLGCSSGLCTILVCAIDDFCCNVAWDSICADEAAGFGCCDGTPQCSVTCCLDSDADGLCDGDDSCPLTPNSTGASDCCVASGGLGCSDDACEVEICAIDSFCCNVAWDTICAAEAKRSATCLLGCGGALFPEPILAAPDKASFVWMLPHDVVWARGDVSQIIVGYPQDASGAIGGATVLPAPEVPASGQVFWWLVRPDCPGGSWSSGGSGQCGTPLSPPCPGGIVNRDYNLP